MANLIRRDPFTDLRSTMDRLFDDGFSRHWRVIPGVEYREATFPIEVSETEGEIEVKASLPGVKPDEVDITVNNDVLTIKAEHKAETVEDTEARLLPPRDSLRRDAALPEPARERRLR